MTISFVGTLGFANVLAGETKTINDVLTEVKFLLMNGKARRIIEINEFFFSLYKGLEVI